MEFGDALKSGVNPQFPTQGTPQGGVVSPLLANIALNGIERIGEFKGKDKIRGICVRYADDMVYVLRPQDNAQEILRRNRRIPSPKRNECKSKENEVNRPHRWI